MEAKHISTHCWGKCNRTYRECLKHNGIDLKENGKEMSKQIKRNLTHLFSVNSPDRLHLGGYVWRSKTNFVDKFY